MIIGVWTATRHDNTKLRGIYGCGSKGRQKRATEFTAIQINKHAAEKDDEPAAAGELRDPVGHPFAENQIPFEFDVEVPGE